MLRKLKVCFATGTIDRMKYDGTGGVPKLIVNLANDLAVNKKATVLSSFQGDKDPQFEVSDDVTVQHLQKIFQHRSDLSTLKKILFWLFIFTRLCIYKISKKNRFDYVITCSPAISLMNIFISKFTKEKVIVWENVALNRYGKFLLVIRCWFYRNATLYVTSTKSDCDFLRLKGVNFCFIPNINYSDPMIYFDRSDRKSHNRFLAVGRLVDQKNFMSLVKIFGELINTDVDWKLTLVGSGPDEKKIKAFVDENNLSDKVSFVPHVENLAPYYEHSDYFLMTSKYEGSPLVLIEAQSFGLPVVSFDCETGPQEIIDNLTNGYLVENGNINEFASILSKLLRSKNSYDDLSKAAFASSRKFNKSVILNDWLRVLK